MSEPKAWVFGVGFGVALSRLVEIPDEALTVAIPFLAGVMIAEPVHEALTARTNGKKP